MPEGPEIWRTADELTDALAGHQVDELYFAFGHLKEFEERLTGKRVTAVEPRGKALITRFETNHNIYSHNQLYGKWMIHEIGFKPDTNRQLRLAIGNSEYTARLYSASDIEVLGDSDLEKHDYLEKLGPDVLHPDTGFDEVLSRYADDTFQNRKLATLLLDQGFLSGIGNYLRSEILFYAGVHTDAKLRNCTDETKKELARASLKLPERSYETGGITTDPEIVEALKREGKKRRDFRHFVYGRTGDRCYRCGTVVESRKTGGRKLYFCPECQNKV